MKIGYVSAVPIVLFSTAALAQSVQVQVGVPPPPPPPQVVVTTPPPPPPPPPPGYYGPPGRVMYGPAPGDLDRPRFRWAFGVTGGPYVGANIGGAGGFWGQGGVQINRLLGVVYQTHAMLGAVGDRAGSGLFFGGIWLNEAMVDFTIHDFFQVGVGPSFDIFSVNNFTEGFVGVDGRVGFALGRIGPWRRSGFFIGLDVHPTFITDSTFPTTSVITSVLLSLGGGWY